MEQAEATPFMTYKVTAIKQLKKMYSSISKGMIVQITSDDYYKQEVKFPAVALSTVFIHLLQQLIEDYDFYIPVKNQRECVLELSNGSWTPVAVCNLISSIFEDNIGDIQHRANTRLYLDINFLLKEYKLLELP